MPDTDTNDAEVVRRAQAGDVDAAAELYDRHNERIFRYVWSRVRDNPLAEDLTGEVFTRMMARLPGYCSQGVPFRAWLYRIAHNLVVDHYRKVGDRPMVLLEDIEEQGEDENNPATVVEQRLLAQQIRRALDRLEPAQREVVALRFLAGLSLEEVASALDKTIASVKALQYRGLIALRTELREQQ